MKKALFNDPLSSPFDSIIYSNKIYNYKFCLTMMLNNKFRNAVLKYVEYMWIRIILIPHLILPIDDFSFSTVQYREKIRLEIRNVQKSNMIIPRNELKLRIIYQARIQ